MGNEKVLESIAEGQAKQVVLCWATKKRHIAIGQKVLCQPNHTSAGYSVRNGGYNSLALYGIPTYHKHGDDTPGSHGDGIIEYKPLSEQKLRISTKTICKQCLKKFDLLWVGAIDSKTYH